MIYGVAVMAACFVTGRMAGDLLGQWIGVDANVGGVGFSMILLIFSMQWLRAFGPATGVSTAELSSGAISTSPSSSPLSAIQNVKGAIGSGVIAILTGVIPTAFAFCSYDFFRDTAVAVTNRCLMDKIYNLLTRDGVLIAVISTAAVLLLSSWASIHLTRKKIPGPAIAIFAGLILAYAGAVFTGGNHGIADIGLW